jgi:hypothetical protein
MFEVYVPGHRNRHGDEQPDRVYGSGETIAEAELEAAQQIRREDEWTQLCIVAQFNVREVPDA